jgi:5-methylcytosine-specific restriction endonuclease McrA
MKRYWLGSLRDHELMQGLQSLVTQDRKTTAELLAHLAEVERRRLYAPAGYPSMFTYCVRALHFSEHMAYARIRAARLARRWPEIYPAIADGRPHLSALARLAPVLTGENAAELLKAAEHKTRDELEALLAARFPQPDLPTQVHVLVPVSANVTSTSCQLVPERVGPIGHETSGAEDGATSPELVRVLATEQTVDQARRAAVTPLSSHRVAIQATVDRATYAKLEEARALLGHAVPAGDLAQLLDRALDALLVQLRTRRCAQVQRPRDSRPVASRNPRRVTAAVRRAVWARDGSRCTFVSDAGHRCEARDALELDHVTPVARGGVATVANLRLRCPAHNQLAADRTYGAGFMREKRTAARPALDAEGMPLLRSLGFRADEVRRGVAACAHLASASLDARLRVALASLAPAGRRTGSPVAPGPA